MTYLDGEWVPDTEARVHVSDRGFLLGDGVFDAFRTFAGRPFRLTEHVERLLASLTALGLNRVFSGPEWGALAEEAVARNAALLAETGDVIGTIVVTRGRHSYVTDAGMPTVCVRVRPIPFETHAHLYEHGAKAVTAPTTYAVPPHVKHISRLAHVLAELDAAHEDPEARVILIDEAGLVREGTTFNVFAVIDGRLVTPRPEHALLGVSRQTTLELAEGIGVRTAQRDLPLSELAAASELLITATSYCVLPVFSVDGAPIGEAKPGRISAALLTAWSELVGLDIAQQARARARVRTGTAVGALA